MNFDPDSKKSRKYSLGDDWGHLNTTWVLDDIKYTLIFFAVLQYCGFVKECPYFQETHAKA